ncbi:tryptophan 2,3-dioxygenase family protein [Phytohabitans kaempferiae]|uniref:Tryptophan 2,3-dioxygenase family protein n=1 Tax=Phytohabitans kaempferiae TaxID=1620943 RepID=A0ABV6M9P6_9ACTN
MFPPTSEYGRYMRTDLLSSLRMPTDQLAHRDEALFRTVHQVHELWLLQASGEAATATARIAAGGLDDARDLLGRVCRVIALLTGGLELLTTITPHDFAIIRAVLKDGSGAQSPGWRALREAARELRGVLQPVLAAGGGARLEAGGVVDPAAFRLVRVLLDLDCQVSIWRHHHHLLAARLVGAGGVGTQGMPVDSLSALTGQRLFPELWPSALATPAAGARG